MGRPPSNGGPSFRFNPTEVAEMEAILQAHKTQVPSREVLVALADKFSSSSDRAGKITVQMKQVWNWFQNRRYAIRAKASRNPVKLSSSPAPSNLPQVPQFMSMSVNPSQATIRNLPQVLLPVSSASVPNAGQSTSDNLLMEYEARSARDGAWYDVATFISHRSVETTDPEVLVRFAGLGPEEDEWVNIHKHVRQRSLPCEASECVAVCQADLILCFQEGKDQALYYDAHVLDAQRRRHDVRGCRCRFLVRYDHDQSEEIVPLKKVCRRPETDYRMQQLAESGNINGNKVNLEPHSGNTVTPSSSEKLVKAETKEQPKVASTQSVLPPITNTNASVTTVAVANSVSAAYPACFVAPAAQPTASVVTTTIPISQSTVSGATLPPVSTSNPAVFSGDLGATVTTAATSTVVGSITSGTTVSAAGTTNPDAQAIVSEASLFTESAKSLAVHSIDSGTPYPTSAQPTSGATPFTVRATNEAVAVCDSQATAPTNEVVQVSASEVPAITISESQAIASGNETDPVSGSLATVSSTEAVPVSGSLATLSSTEAVLVSDSQAAASMNESVAVDDSQAPASMSEVIPVSDSLAAESVNEEVPVSDSQDVSMNEATPVSDSQAAASVNEVIPLSGSQAGLIPVGDSQTDVSKKEAILLGDSQADASMNEAVVPVSDAQADVSVSEAITVSNDQADVPMNEADVSMNEGVSDSQADASMSEAIPVGDSQTDVSKKEVIPVGDSQADVSMSKAIPVTDAQADASRNEAVAPVSDAQADVSVSEAIPVSNDQADVSMNEAVSDSQADASMNEAVPASDSHATASIHKVLPIANNGSVTQEATLSAATATTPAVQLTEPPVTAALVIDSLYSEASASPKTQTHNASESIDSEASVFVVAAEATPAVQPINSGPIVSMVTAITSGSPTTQDANSSLSGTAVTTSGALSAAGATDSVVTTATITPVSSPANEAGASDSVLPATTVDSDQVQEITDSMATEED